jgi:nitrate reductase (NAD(P)H)
MTTGFHLLEIGDEVELKGPLGSFVWTGNGTAMWKGVRRRMKRIGLICGGSGMWSLCIFTVNQLPLGITPILQVIRGVLQDTSDTLTELWVLTSNKTEVDILCRSELDSYAETHGSRYHVYHTIGSLPQDSPGGWKGGLGRIDDEMLKSTMPPAPNAGDPDSEGSLVLVCGPEGMIEGAVKPGLKRLGWDLDTSLVVF